MFRKLSLELEQHCSKGEDKGGSVTGQFCEIGQNRGELGKTGREQIFLSLLSILDVSQLQLITLNQKLSESRMKKHDFKACSISEFQDESTLVSNMRSLVALGWGSWLGVTSRELTRCYPEVKRWVCQSACPHPCALKAFQCRQVMCTKFNCKLMQFWEAERQRCKLTFKSDKL